MTDGERHKQIRTRLGRTQDEFAQILGVAGETVSRWENGHHAPPPHAARILRALNTIIDTPDLEATVTQALEKGPLYTLHTLLRLAYKEK